MTPSEIIKADCERRGVDYRKEFMFIKSAIDKAKGILLRAENTLMLAVPIGKGDVELHMYTADSPLKLYKAVIELRKKLQNGGVKKAYTEITNPQVEEMAKRTDWNVQPSDKERYNFMAVLGE